jgi:hypothetical protein
MNNALFPWLILVPRLPEMREIIDLNPSQQYALMDEIAQASRVLQGIYRPDKINVAALGNQVPQLHVHHVVRREADAAWPRPIWGVVPMVPYTVDGAASALAELRELLADMGLATV